MRHVKAGQGRNPNKGCGAAFGIGCGVAIGLFLIALIIGGIVSGVTGSSSNDRVVRAGHNARVKSRRVADNTVPGEVDWCSRASDMENTSVKELDSGLYQSAYIDAVKGLSDNDQCANDDAELVNHGYLLSMKALAEHHLSAGDAATDLNQADQLLEECVTRPGLYGTQTGAGCETQQENNIRAKTDWELNQ